MYLYFVIACIPILWIMVSLGKFKIPGYKACPTALLITFLLAIFVWKMNVKEAITSVLEGFALALWTNIFAKSYLNTGEMSGAAHKSTRPSFNCAWLVPSSSCAWMSCTSGSPAAESPVVQLPEKQHLFNIFRLHAYAKTPYKAVPVALSTNIFTMHAYAKTILKPYTRYACGGPAGQSVFGDPMSLGGGPSERRQQGLPIP